MFPNSTCLLLVIRSKIFHPSLWKVFVFFLISVIDRPHISSDSFHYSKHRNGYWKSIRYQFDFDSLWILDCSVSTLILGNITDTQLFSYVVQADFSNLPSLGSLTVASQSLARVRSFSFADSPLSTINIGSNSLQKTQSFDIGSIQSFSYYHARRQGSSHPPSWGEFAYPSPGIQLGGLQCSWNSASRWKSVFQVYISKIIKGGEIRIDRNWKLGLLIWQWFCNRCFRSSFDILHWRFGYDEG